MPRASTTKPSMVRGAVCDSSLKRLIAYWTYWRMPALSVLPVCIALNASVFAQDLPSGSCQAANSLSVLVQNRNVIAYIPKGAWTPTWDVPGITNKIDVLNIEGNGVTPTEITTPNTVNSCASNSLTGQTVCTADTNDVYLIQGTALQSTLQSSGVPTLRSMFFEGNCTNCGVTMDALANRAVIGVNLSSDGVKQGFQVLDLASPATFQDPIASQAIGSDGIYHISPGILVDPIGNQVLSPNQQGTIEIVILPDQGTDPVLMENVFKDMPAFGSAAEDCTRGILLATVVPQDPSKVQVYVADLKGADNIPDSPAGTWNAPSHIQTLTESQLSFGANGIAMVQGTGIGIVTGEFGAVDPFFNQQDRGDWVTAIALDPADDADPPIADYNSCRIPGGFKIGLTPHAVTVYQSPRTGHAMALVANWDLFAPGVTTLAVIDLTQMLDPNIVARTQGTGLGHACGSPDQTLSTAGFNPVVRLIDLATALTPFDFSLSLAKSVSVTAGESVSFPVSLGLVSGLTQFVSFSVSGLPSGATGVFSRFGCSPDCTATLTITTSESTVAGAYPITVKGSSGSLSHTESSTLTVISASDTSSLVSGLMGYWRLDEGGGLTTYDSSGNGNNGILINNPVWTTGKAGKALQFNVGPNVGNDVLRQNAASVSIGRTFDIPQLPFTLTAWINPASDDDWHAIFSKRDLYDASMMRFDIGLHIDSGQVYLTTGQDFVIFDYIPPKNAWTHIAVVATNTDIELYVNGLFQERCEPVRLGTGATANTAIGGTGEGVGGDNDPFIGIIDEVRVYNRVLSAHEVRQVYGATTQ
jgi:hypothetical protein